MYVKRTIFFFLPFLLFFTDNGKAVLTRKYELRTEAYGNHPMQKFNLYLPPGSGQNTPVLVMIHGGYWRFGNKNMFHYYISRLQKLLPDYAFVSIGYRLFDGHQNRFPIQEQDVAACINYVFSNHRRLNISDQFALYGSSIGAQLAMLYAYKTTAGFQPKATISVAGVTDLMPIFEDENYPAMHQVLMDMAGNPPVLDSALYNRSSPIRFAGRVCIPTLILHGTDDSAVPYQQSQQLADTLSKHKIEHVLRLFPDEDHPLVGAQKEMLVEIKTFLDKYMNEHGSPVKLN